MKNDHCQLYQMRVQTTIWQCFLCMHRVECCGVFRSQLLALWIFSKRHWAFFKTATNSQTECAVMLRHIFAHLPMVPGFIPSGLRYGSLAISLEHQKAIPFQIQFFAVDHATLIASICKCQGEFYWTRGTFWLQICMYSFSQQYANVNVSFVALLRQKIACNGRIVFIRAFDYLLYIEKFIPRSLKPAGEWTWTFPPLCACGVHIESMVLITHLKILIWIKHQL